MKGNLKVSTFALLQLDALEEGLEVAGAEAGMVAALNDLDEGGWTILERFREDLKVKVPIALKVPFKKRTLLYFVRASIPVLLTSCLTGLDLTRCVNLYIIYISKAEESYPVKQEVSHTGISE